MEKLLKCVLTLGIMISTSVFFVNANDDAWTSKSCVAKEEEFSGGVCRELSFGYTKPYCVKSDLDNSQCIWNTLTNVASKDLKSADTLRNVIESYCKVMLGESGNGRIYYSKPNDNINPSENPDNWDWQQTFDSHQSLFVYAFCSSFEDAEGNKPFLSEGAILGDAFTGASVSKVLKLQQKSGRKNLCEIKDSNGLVDCEMSIYPTEIFTAIMSDLFKIKYAQVFHVQSVEKFSNKEDRIMAFLSGYFNITDSYQNVQPNYPQTVEVIDSNQQFYKNVLSKLKLLNNKELSERAEKLGCPETGNIAGVDFIACALHGSQGKGLALDPAFVTLFYNEVMNYRIFISYLEKWYDYELEKALKNKDVKVNEKNVRILQSKALDFQLYANMQIEAAEQTLYDLEELNMTYPYHIGLLLYQEKVKKFRDLNLSSIVTLFYSLSEKLQNVQIPNDK